MRHTGPESARGSALVWVLVVAAVLSLLAAAVARANVFGLRSATFWQERLQAFYAAESGLNVALYRLWELREPLPAPGSTDCTRSPWFESSPDDFPGKPDTGYRVCVEEGPGGRVLVARGYSGRSTRTVRLTLRRPRSAAEYFPEDRQENGVIEVGDGEWEWPEVALPDLAPPSGTPEGPELAGDPATMPPGTYRYDKLEVEKNATLRIQGPATIYVKEDVRVKDNAVLEVTGSGAVSIYVKGDFDLANRARFVRTQETALYVGKGVKWENNARVEGSGRLLIVLGGDLEVENGVAVNSGASADAMGIYLTTDAGHKVKLKNNATFVGGLYAPTAAKVEIENNASLVGAAVGETVTLDKNATTAWDPRVQDAPAPDAGGTGGGTWVADWGTWSEE